MILLLTKDLFFVPVVRSAAELAGSTVSVVKQLPEDLPGSSEFAETQAALVDLSSISLADLDSISAALDTLPNCRVKAAFGSHVHAIRLEKAAEAGFQPVMTKGQLSGQAPAIINSWLSNGS